MQRVITWTDLDVGYAKRRPVQRNLSGNVEVGRVTAITGPSGSGKSTLLYTMAGLLRPLRGSVNFAEALDVWGCRDARRSRYRAEQCGFLFQDYLLNPSRTIFDTIVEPLLYVRSRASSKQVEQRVTELLDLCAIGLDPYTRPFQISGGQAQRVALSRALIGDPVVLFADEPTSALDSETADVIFDVLEAMLTSASSRLSAVVFATHAQSVMDRCDHVLSIEPLATG